MTHWFQYQPVPSPKTVPFKSVSVSTRLTSGKAKNTPVTPPCELQSNRSKRAETRLQFSDFLVTFKKKKKKTCLVRITELCFCFSRSFVCHKHKPLEVFDATCSCHAGIVSCSRLASNSFRSKSLMSRDGFTFETSDR